MENRSFILPILLDSVDFIKMDNEGAELRALVDARETILAFRPKLAISIYHDIKDFRRIPSFIESTGVKYKYYLEHQTMFEPRFRS